VGGEEGGGEEGEKKVSYLKRAAPTTKIEFRYHWYMLEPKNYMERKTDLHLSRFFIGEKGQPEGTDESKGKRYH